MAEEAELRNIFRMVDVDSSGSMDPDELLALGKCMYHAYMHSCVCMHMCSMCDVQLLAGKAATSGTYTRMVHV